MDSSFEITGRGITLHKGKAVIARIGQLDKQNKLPKELNDRKAIHVVDGQRGMMKLGQLGD